MYHKKLIGFKVIIFFVVSILVSCGSSKIHKTFGFVDFKDINELSGNYSGTSSLSMRHNYPINVSETFFIKDREIETFDLSFPDSKKVIFTYQLKGDLTKKELVLEGKKTKNAFVIYLNKNNLLIPFVIDNTDVNQINIGKNTKNELIIETHIEKAKAVLPLGYGKAKYYNDVRVFKKN